MYRDGIRKAIRMKAGVIITGSGSVLVLTSCDTFESPDLVTAFRDKGITKYLAFEVPIDLVKNRYGRHFDIAMADRKQSDILRVVDVDGQRIFTNLPLEAFGQPISHDEQVITRKAA